jgi:RHS repeat-associated protein
VYYYFADHLGSTRVVTSATGSPCYQADFLPYGQENTPASFSNTCSTNYKFTGYERDTETSNDYAFARYYSYHLERFLSPDPLDGDISDPQTLNKYTYVRNNPVNLTDPTGLCGAGEESTDCPAYPCDGMNCGGEGGAVFSYDDAPWPPPTPAMDQFGCETNGIPCGMQFPVGGGGLSGCTYGAGNCGGMIYGWTNVNGNVIGDYNGEELCSMVTDFGCGAYLYWNLFSRKWQNKSTWILSQAGGSAGAPLQAGQRLAKTLICGKSPKENTADWTAEAGFKGLIWEGIKGFVAGGAKGAAEGASEGGEAGAVVGAIGGAAASVACKYNGAY